MQVHTCTAGRCIAIERNAWKSYTCARVFPHCAHTGRTFARTFVYANCKADWRVCIRAAGRGVSFRLYFGALRARDDTFSDNELLEFLELLSTRVFSRRDPRSHYHRDKKESRF